MVDPALVAFSFTAGVFAFFSPCGVPMLPAYLAYYLPRGGASRGAALARGLAGGTLAATGALAVLGVIGLAAAVLGAPFRSRVIWLELVGGLVVLALGILTLLGRSPGLRIGLRPSEARSAWALVGFGALYAGVAASCVAPVFLSVLAISLAAPTALDRLVLVGAYGAGLALLLVGATVLVATAQEAPLRWVKRALPYVERTSGLVLVLVGLYLVAYWARTGLGWG